jgi:polar amino acid transport system permease protein
MEAQLILQSLPLLVKGLFVTLQVFCSAAILSFFLGSLMGIFSSTQVRIPFIEKITFVLRAVPFYIQLLIVYFVLPEMVGCNLDPFIASVIALGVCSSGYVAQIIRGGMNNISRDQWEAATTLGYTKTATLRFIILPQVFRQSLPAFSNELDAMLKSTAVVSTIGMLELTRMGMNIVSREMKPVPIYLTVAIFYLCLSTVLNFITKRLERKR